MTRPCRRSCYTGERCSFLGSNRVGVDPDRRSRGSADSAVRYSEINAEDVLGKAPEEDRREKWKQRACRVDNLPKVRGRYTGGSVMQEAKERRQDLRGRTFCFRWGAVMAEDAIAWSKKHTLSSRSAMKSRRLIISAFSSVFRLSYFGFRRALILAFRLVYSRDPMNGGILPITGVSLRRSCALTPVGSRIALNEIRRDPVCDALDLSSPSRVMTVLSLFIPFFFRFSTVWPAGQNLANAVALTFQTSILKSVSTLIRSPRRFSDPFLRLDLAPKTPKSAGPNKARWLRPASSPQNAELDLAIMSRFDAGF